MVKLSAMKTTRAWISRWRDALWSNPSGWLVLLLVGLLYGLAKLRLLPLELGFAGSAAIVLAAYFLCRDAFRTDLSVTGLGFSVVAIQVTAILQGKVLAQNTAQA
jgi:hypothetical protein